MPRAWYDERESNSIKVHYFDSEYVEKETKTVRVGNVLFTKSGQALHRAISVKKRGIYCTTPYFETPTVRLEKIGIL